MRFIKLINKTITKWFSEPTYQNIEAFIIYNNKISKRIIDKGPVNGRLPDDRFWRLYNYASNHYEFIPKQDVFLKEDDAKQELKKRFDNAYVHNKLSLKNIKFEKMELGHLYLFDKDKYKYYFHHLSYENENYNWYDSEFLSEYLPYAGRVIISIIEVISKSESLTLNKFNKIMSECPTDNIVVFYYDNQLDVIDNKIIPIKYGNDYVITCSLASY